MSAQILPFTGQPRSRTSLRKGGADAASSVIILPCVRYERWSDETGPDASRGDASLQLATAACH